MAYGDLPLDAPHKPNKGLEGGACNRQSCQAEPALYYNHGSLSWYCADCAHDIGQDHINLRDWELNWKPRLGHDMFETREQMDARLEADKVSGGAFYHAIEQQIDSRMIYIYLDVSTTEGGLDEDA
jgi:hypothetical protein